VFMLPGAFLLSERDANYTAISITWRVLNGVTGEGILLAPREGPHIANCIVVPDADQSPEMIAGLAPGLAPEAQIARRLAESGCRVLVPLIMDRRDMYSAITGRTPTNQPHREFIYRPA